MITIDAVFNPVIGREVMRDLHSFTIKTCSDQNHAERFAIWSACVIAAGNH